jgi:alpha-mannosidase
MKHLLVVLLACAVCCRICFAQQDQDSQKVRNDIYAGILARLATLSGESVPEWRWHEDVAHPEDEGLDDASWPVVKVTNDTISEGTRANNPTWSGARVFRRVIVIPDKINGYGTEGSRVFLDLRFTSQDVLLPINLMVTVFSNGTTLFRGADDTLNPLLLTENAHAGQRFLVSLRVVGGNTVWSSFVHSSLTIEPPPTRPDPSLLREEILCARTMIGAYPEGSVERGKYLDDALQAIDFTTLERGDQKGFDNSLEKARKNLEALKPWLAQFSIRAVGNSHIDMAWLWSWTETVEIVRNTFRSVLDLMREYPDFRFTMSSAQAYAWMEQKYPDIFEEIRQRVKEGRWEIVGGMWVEPDLNMPSGESLVRQILIGKRYFLSRFGIDVNIGWNPDSFGYNWQLPQIYKKSGIDYFVTQKLIWAHDFTTFPYKLFWWESPDGSRVLTYFPHHYGGGIDAESLGTDLSIWAPSIYGQNAAVSPEIMHLYGVGDHGGGPTRIMLDNAEKLRAPDAVFPRFEFGLPRDFFADLGGKLPKMNIPTWNNELYFQSHRGVFTSQSETKRRIRRGEEQVLTAEKFASLALLFGCPYPEKQLESAWKDLLFDEFHDVMPGSGIGVNYAEAEKNLEGVEYVTNTITQDALTEIAAHADTRGTGTPLIVFNSLAWARTDVVEAEVQLPQKVDGIQVLDAQGKTVMSQIVSQDTETHRVRLLLRAHVPALGFRTYFVRGQTRNVPGVSEVKSSADSLENEYLRLTVDRNSGCMTRLVIKATNKNVLAPAETDSGGSRTSICGNLLQAFADTPRLMGVWNLDAWNIDEDFEKQHWDLDRADEVQLVESGPLRAILRVKNHFGRSTFERDITVYAGVPRVDVKMRVEWKEKHILLKVAFPLSVHNKRAAFEIPFGSIERPTTRSNPEEAAQFEVPSQRWADLSNPEYGFSLLNNSKYGYDAKGNVLRLSLLRSPTFPDPHSDEGFHEFVYSLYPHSGSWRDARTILRGYELNEALTVRPANTHQGSLGPEHSFLTVGSDNVVITAFKKAEDSNAIVLRFYEWAGRGPDVRLTLPAGALSGEEVDLMENGTHALELKKGVLTVPTKPYEIKTVRVKFREKATQVGPE